MTSSWKVILFTGIVAPVVVVTLYSYTKVDGYSTEQIYRERSNISSLATNVLKEKLDRLKDLGVSLATRPVLCQHVDKEEWQQAIDLVKNVPNDFIYIDRLFITDTLGTLKADFPADVQTHGRNFAGGAWFKGFAMNHQPFLSEVYRRDASPRRVVGSLALPIRNSSGKLKGILVLQVKVTSLLEWSSQLSIGKSGFVYVVDQKGRIAANPDYPDADSIIDYSAAPAVQRALQGKKGIEILYNPIARQNRLSAYEQVPGYGWAIIVQQEAGAAFADSKMPYLVAFYSFAVLLAIGLALIVIRLVMARDTLNINLKKIAKERGKKLAESESQYRSLFEFSSVGHVVVDHEGTITAVNAKMAEEFGYAAGELTGKKIEVLIPSVLREQHVRHREAFAELPRNRKMGAGMNLSGLRKDGTTFPLEISLNFFYYSGKLMVAALVVDITQRRVAEEKLEASERRFRALIENSHDMLTLFGRDGRIEYLSPAVERTLGLINDKPNQWQETIVHPDDLKTAEELFRASLKNPGVPVSSLLRSRNSGGTYLWIEGTLTNMLDTPGVGAIVYNCHDVTEKKRLEDQHALLAAIVDSSDDAIIAKRLDGTITSWNHGAQRLFGFSGAEAIGKNVSILIPRNQLDEEPEIVGKVKQGKHVEHFETLRVRKNGTAVFVSLTVSPIRDSSGVIVGASKIARDISDRKRSEELLRASEGLYRSLFENLLHGFAYCKVIYDGERAIDFEFVNVNAAYESLSGLGNLSGRKVSELIPRRAETDFGHFDMIGRVASGGKPEKVEAFNTTLNRWFAISMYCPEKGYFVSLIDNITERKRAEEQLLYQSNLLKHINDAVVATDNQFHITSWNSAAEKMYGWTAAEVLGQLSTDFIRSDMSLEQRAIILKELQQQGLYQSEVVQYNRAGRAMTIEANTIALFDEHKQYAGLLSVNRDITFRKEAEAKLTQERSLLRTLIDNIPDYIYVKDIRSRHLINNKANLELLGVATEAESVGRSVSDFFGIEKSRPYLDADLAIFRSGKAVFNHEETIQSPTGELKYLLTTKVPLKDERDTVIGLVGISRDITWQKKIEFDLREKKYFLEKAQQVGQIGYWISQLERDTLTWSDETCRIFGIEPAAFNGKLQTFFGFVHPDDLDGLKSTMAHAIKNKIPYKLDHRIIRSDGNVRWVYEQAEPTYDESGNAALVIGIVQDITERKNAEEKLAKNEERFRTLIERISDGFVSFDRDLRYTYANKRAGEMTHKDPEWLIGKNVWDVFPEAVGSSTYDAFNQALTSQKYFTNTDYFQPLDLWQENHFYPAEDGVSLFIRDISDRKRAERKLVESERRFRALIENSSEGISLTDAFAKPIYRSPAVEKITGASTRKSEESTLGFAHPDDMPLMKEKFAEAGSKPGIPIPFQSRFIHQLGHTYWLEGTLTNMMEVEGVSAMVANFRDISTRKKAEEQILNLNTDLEKKVADRTAQLELANKELEGFTYSVSHDLRSPLRIIDGYSQILIEDYSSNLGEEGQKTLSVITNNAQKMGHLIDELLDFSRLGRTKLSTTMVDMNDIVAEAVHELRNGGISFPAQFHVGELAIVNADSGLMKQVWINLISNAIKYSGRKKNPVIEIGVTREEDRTIYYVQDNGAGFNMKYYGKLFGVFQRLHDQEEFEGTGVGLALVQRIINRHGGTIWAEAKPGKGATFNFTLADIVSRNETEN